tara:strand:+ start:230 stop:355 length:126 start_codon:yes stop_codon:yes gene_type:complete
MIIMGVIDKPKRKRKIKRKKRIVSGYYFDGKKMTILYEKRR